MPKVTRDEEDWLGTREGWLDWLQGQRVELAKLPDTDPRKAELAAVLTDFEGIHRDWCEIDELDPERAAEAVEKICRIMRGKP